MGVVIICGIVLACTLALLTPLHANTVPDRLKPFALPAHPQGNPPAALAYLSERENDTFSTSFKEYLHRSIKMITAAQQHRYPSITPHALQKRVELIAPFQWQPEDEPKCHNRHYRTEDGRYRWGVILIHGLTDSPYTMRPLANFFLKQCYLVRSILLPGHGTVPGDLLHVKKNMFLDATRYGMARTAPHVENLVAVGFSLGATTILDVAIDMGFFDQNPNHLVPLKAIVMVSPALALPWTATLAGTMGIFKAWYSVHDDMDFAKYESFPLNAAAQLHTLVNGLQKKIKTKIQRPAPVFVALSQDDSTLDAKQVEQLISNHLHKTSPLSRMVRFQRNPTGHNKEPELLEDGKNAPLFTIPSTHQGLHILDMSHLGIAIPIDDAHYGIHGDYRNCLHYGVKETDRDACLQGKKHLFYGETHKDNLGKHLVRRLTFNPDYELLMHQLHTFLVNLGLVIGVETPETTLPNQELLPKPPRNGKPDENGQPWNHPRPPLLPLPQPPEAAIEASEFHQSHTQEKPD